MQTFFGMILGALLLVCGVYVYDSMRRRASPTVRLAGQPHHRQLGRRRDRLGKLKARAHDEWVRISSK